jgi:hypothetical protein
MNKLKVIIILIIIGGILGFIKGGLFSFFMIAGIEFMLFTAIVILGIFALLDFFNKKNKIKI